jgi:hypothetical protein
VTDRYEVVISDNEGVLIEPTDTGVPVDAFVASFRAFGVEIDCSLSQETVNKDAAPIETVREHRLNPEAFWHYRNLSISLAQQIHVRESMSTSTYQHSTDSTFYSAWSATISTRQSSS